MFGLFKKRKKGWQPVDSPGLTDAAAEKGASIIISVQQKWASGMNKLTRHWTSPQKKLALVSFCLLLGAHSGIALYQAFNPKPAKKTVIPVTRIKPPLLQDNKTSLPTFNDPAYRRVKEIHAYLDSLKGSTVGRAKYDSLIQQRPGLMDTIIMIENFYQTSN